MFETRLANDASFDTISNDLPSTVHVPAAIFSGTTVNGKVTSFVPFLRFCATTDKTLPAGSFTSIVAPSTSSCNSAIVTVTPVVLIAFTDSTAIVSTLFSTYIEYYHLLHCAN